MSSSIKFPRTKRDRFKDEDLKFAYEDDKAAPETSPIYKPSSKKLQLDDSSHAPPSEPQSYPSTYVPGSGQGGLFASASTQPLAANVQSWHNLDLVTTDSAAPREEYDDEVFDDEDDDYMRKLRLGLVDPRSGYVYNTTGGPYGFYAEELDGLSDYDFGIKGAASCLDIFFCFWGIGSYLFDVGTDVYLAHQYYVHGHYAWFALTLAFVAVPALTMTVFSLVLYIRDWRIVKEKSSPQRWVSRVVLLFLQLAPLLRILETMSYACKSRNEKDITRRRRLYERMVDEDTDSMLLRLFECFMEAAPQLVLQLYILARLGSRDGLFLLVLQCLGMASSLLALASGLVSYHRSLRLSMPGKAKMTMAGMCTQFLWRALTIAARVMALAIFASQFKYWVFVVVGVHFLGMLVWVIRQQTDYCYLDAAESSTNGDQDVSKPQARHSQPLEICFRILTAFVQIFCFFNLLEGHTRLRALVFYAVVYVENAAMVLVWYVTASTLSSSDWFHAPVLLVVMGGFWLGILFMVLYYKLCHPNNSSVLHIRSRIRWCVPCADMSLTRDGQGDRDGKPHGVQTADRDQEEAVDRIRLSLSRTTDTPRGFPVIYESPDATTATPLNGHQPKPVRTPRMESSPLGSAGVQGPTPPRSHPAARVSSINSRTSSRPGSEVSTRTRFVQPKWTPPERPAAGALKHDLTLDSDTASSVGRPQGGRRTPLGRGLAGAGAGPGGRRTPTTSSQHAAGNTSMISDGYNSDHLIVMSTVV